MCNVLAVKLATCCKYTHVHAQLSPHAINALSPCSMYWTLASLSVILLCSVLGSNVVGIWPKNSDKGDVNTAHLNHSGSALATGDDFGCVKLFDHFPISEKYVRFRYSSVYVCML